MPKSTAIPTKSTAKATEIGLSGPTTPTAKTPQAMSPTMSVVTIAARSRSERRASSSHRQSNPTESAGETELPRGVVDGLGGARPRLKVAVIEDRLGQDETAQFVLLGLLAGQQVLPRQPLVPPGERGLAGLVDGGEGRADLLGVGRASRGALRRQVERVEHAAQARVGRERTDQRLGGDDLVGEVLHVLLRQEEQAILLEEISAVGTAYALEQILLRGELCRERLGRVLGLVRGLRLDQHGQHVDSLREGPLQPLFLQAPRQVRIDELVDVGVDADALTDEKTAPDRKREHDRHQHHRVAAARLDNAAQA